MPMAVMMMTVRVSLPMRPPSCADDRRGLSIFQYRTLHKGGADAECPTNFEHTHAIGVELAYTCFHRGLTGRRPSAGPPGW
jgi:hypothetical protein